MGHRRRHAPLAHACHLCLLASRAVADGRALVGGAHGSREKDKGSSIRPASRAAGPYPDRPETRPPPERHALRRIAGLSDLAHVNSQARSAPVSPAAIDALAALAAGTADIEVDPAGAQDDSEPAIVSATWT